MTTRTALMLPLALPLEAWTTIGQELHRISDASGWWQGDWLVYGQDRFPDRYLQAAQESGLDYQTLRNYAWVARTFPASRRHRELSLQHHAEVASLSAADQDLWLDRAVAGRWSRNMLRQQLQLAHAGGRDPSGAGNTALSIKAESGQGQRWQEAAQRSGGSVAAWISAALDQAADGVLNAQADRPQVT